MKTSMLLNLNFNNKSILLCFFLFSLIIDLRFLILAAIAQTFNQTADSQNIGDIKKAASLQHSFIYKTQGINSNMFSPCT